MIDPKLDGVEHINIYSKGKTELGRLLTNFAHTPFVHAEYGSFVSVEGFWYWLRNGKQHEELRIMYGFKAKEYGKQFESIGCATFQEDIKEAIRCKMRQNKNILKMLVDSSLPLEHYYWYGSIDNPKVYDLPQYKWITDEISRIRDVCKENQTWMDTMKVKYVEA